MLHILIVLFAVQSAIETIPVKEFASQLNAEVILVDVRTPEEYKTGHIEGAINVSVTSDDFNKEIAKLPKTKTIYMYCKSGIRSQRAALKMKDLGFKKMIQLKGGFLAWQATFEE